MNNGLSPRRILLIEPSRSAVAETSLRIKETCALTEQQLASVIESDAINALRHAVDLGEPPDVILIGERVPNISSLMREVQHLHLDANLIFLEYHDQPSGIAEKLVHIPMAGLSWSVATTHQADFANIMHDAARTAMQRRRLRQSIDKANRQLSSFQNAAAEKQAQAAKSEHYLANFLVHVQDAIVALDSDFTVLYWSAGAVRLFSLRAKDAIGVAAYTLPFWSTELEQRLTQLPLEAGNITIESTLPTSDKTLVIESVCSAVRDEKAQFIGSSLVIRDVTARHLELETERAERSKATRIIDSERRHLRSLFQQAPGFIAVTVGPQHIFEVVNDAYLQVMGERVVLGKPVAEALPEMQGQEFFKLLNRAYSSGEPYIGRGIPVALQRQPETELETLYVDFVFQPIVEEDGTVSGIFCQGSDVTEHKLTQEKLALHQSHLEQLVEERTQQLEASQHALQRSQKLEAIGQLTGGVAHDFNNVLQIIASNLQLLQMSGDKQRHDAFISSAIDAVERGTKLSSQLLAFARRQPLDPIALNLGRVLRGMDDLLRRALGETIEIETIVAGGLWNTLVDPNQLENVILNLAINARDAMAGGGKLTMELGNAMLDDRYVQSHPDVPAGQYVLLAVSDTGSGMAQEVIERAFDPFFTTKSEGSGTGLGLSMAYGFVKQSGGHIKIYSESGCGTTFKIYLPRSFESEVEIPRFAPGPVVGGCETILVVEDDPAVQDAAVVTLQELGYKVLRANDGQSALSVLQSGMAVDLLFTDVVMPGPLRSPDLALQAKQILPDIAVLFTSGYTQNAIVHAGRLDPGVELLSKPYRREDLARKVRYVLASSQQKKPAVAGQAKPELLAAQTIDPLHILVVEDDSESRDAVCNLLLMLGHITTGAASAEAARDALTRATFDVLFTDVNLPGMSGIELARESLQLHSRLKVIIASGYGAMIEHDLPSAPVMLPKPFDLSDLQQALDYVKPQDANSCPA